MNANESLPENTSENTKAPFRGGSTKASDNGEVEIIKREGTVKANDPELQMRITKQSIANFTNESDLLRRIGINPIEENESLCDFFNRFNDAVVAYNGTNRKDLNEQVLNLYKNVDETNKTFNSLMLPRQIMLGIMLNALNSTGEKMDKFIRKLNLAQRTCYNYMNAANVVPYIKHDCVYNLGMMILSGLGEFFKNNKKKIESGDQTFDEIIINYMGSSLELRIGEEAKFDKEYNKRVAYFYYKYGFFGDYEIDDDAYKKLFNSGFEWSFREADRIKKPTLAAKEKGSKKRKINDKDGVNKGIKKLVEDLSGGKDVYNKRRSIDIGCKNSVDALTSIISKLSDVSELSEENLDNLNKLQKQLQECQEKLDTILNKNQEE